ncbi:MAG: hypothetical protein U9Q81_21030 [Pseudomonadota bacterium]|nr:hypothetical protein [Pseudomonadota bacterium]
MIAEVLPPGTQRYDRGDKRLAYFSLSTLQEYVLISQDRLQVEDGSARVSERQRR